MSVRRIVAVTLVAVVCGSGCKSRPDPQPSAPSSVARAAPVASLFVLEAGSAPQPVASASAPPIPSLVPASIPAVVRSASAARARAESAYQDLLDGHEYAAEDGFKDALALGPDRVTESAIRFNQGLLHERQHEVGEARASFVHAYLLSPSAPAAGRITKYTSTGCSVTVGFASSVPGPRPDAGAPGIALLPTTDPLKDAEITRFAGWPELAKARGTSRENLCAVGQSAEALLPGLPGGLSQGRCDGEGPWLIDGAQNRAVVIPYAGGLLAIGKLVPFFMTPRCTAAAHVTTLEQGNGVLHVRYHQASVYDAGEGTMCCLAGVSESDVFLDVTGPKTLAAIDRATREINPSTDSPGDEQARRVGGAGCTEHIGP